MAATEQLAKAAMKQLCLAHPELTYPQVVQVMQEAVWSFDGTKAICTVRLPADINDTIEIKIVPTDDQS